MAAINETPLTQNPQLAQINQQGFGQHAPGAQGSPQDPLMAILSALLTKQAAAPMDFAALASLINKPDVQGERNRSYMPGVDNEFSPFSNGFFKSGAERAQVESDRLTIDPANPVFGQTGVQAGLGPAQVNPEAIYRAPQGVVMPESSFTPGPNPTTRAIPGGFEGMINPQMQGNAKFGDANMFTALPGQAPNVPEGQTIWDGSMIKPKKKKPTATPAY